MHRIAPMGNSYGYDLSVLVRLGTLRICAPSNRLTLAFGACWSRMHSTLRIMAVLLAVCALLIRTFVLRMIRLARIAESALARHMSGCMALGTNAVRTRVRVARVSRRGAYRAILWATLVSRHMCIRATVSADHASISTKLLLLSFPYLFLLQRPLQTPLMICQRSFETPLMVSQRPF